MTTRPTVLFFDPPGHANYGDQLNAWLWPRLLGDRLAGFAHLQPDARPEVALLGIGTLLDADTVPREPTKIVVGSGYGYGRIPVLDASWRIHAVRGPLTAVALGLPTTLAITDPAILVADFPPPATSRGGVGFMPHWEGAPAASWKRVCERAGLRYLDPCTRDVDAMHAALVACDHVVVEAMHGAIVADALRVPWIPITTKRTVNPFKWIDWCASLDLTWHPSQLGNLALAVRRLLPAGAAELERLEGDLADDLRAVAGQAPFLSADAAWSDRRARMRASVSRLADLLDAGQLPPPAAEVGRASPVDGRALRGPSPRTARLNRWAARLGIQARAE